MRPQHELMKFTGILGKKQLILYVIITQYFIMHLKPVPLRYETLYTDSLHVGNSSMHATSISAVS